MNLYRQNVIHLISYNTINSIRVLRVGTLNVMNIVLNMIRCGNNNGDWKKKLKWWEQNKQEFGKRIKQKREIISKSIRNITQRPAAPELQSRVVLDHLRWAAALRICERAACARETWSWKTNYVMTQRRQWLLGWGKQSASLTNPSYLSRRDLFSHPRPQAFYPREKV